MNPPVLEDWLAYEAAHQSEWTDACNTPFEACSVRVPWPNAHCARHTMAFQAFLDTPLDDFEAEARGGRRKPDMSPEARKARALARKREAEALAYVASYSGSWGLPLDIRADRRWGTKYMHLSERQVDALLAGKARDEARQAEFDTWAREHEDVVVWLANHLGTSSFLDDMFASLGRFGHLTDNQLAAVRRSMAVTNGASPVAHVTEGMYRDPEGNIFKVQHTREDHARLYAKRLVASTENRHGTFEYWPGGIRQLRPEWHMTLEEAAEFGKLYGFCCVCGAELTDEKSIAAGIGPICASKV